MSANNQPMMPVCPIMSIATLRPQSEQRVMQVGAHGAPQKAKREYAACLGDQCAMFATIQQPDGSVVSACSFKLGAFVNGLGVQQAILTVAHAVNPQSVGEATRPEAGQAPADPSAKS